MSNEFLCNIMTKNHLDILTINEPNINIKHTILRKKHTQSSSHNYICLLKFSRQLIMNKNIFSTTQSYQQVQSKERKEYIENVQLKQTFNKSDVSKYWKIQQNDWQILEQKIIGIILLYFQEILKLTLPQIQKLVSLHPLVQITNLLLQNTKQIFNYKLNQLVQMLQYIDKMNQKKSVYFELNTDVSPFHSFQHMDEYGKTVNQIKDDSISILHKFQDSKNNLSILPLQENMNNITTKKPFTFLDVVNQQSQVQKMNDQSQSGANPMHQQKKGLRYLASLVYETLKKKKLSSHLQVVNQIEKHLLKERRDENFMDKNNTNFYVIQKEGKNIRRRLYDALNVMNAAQIIQKTVERIEICDSCQCPNKYGLSLKKQALQKKFQALETRVQKKRKQVQRLTQIKNSLDQLIIRNQTNKIQESKKVYFPIIIVKSQDAETMEVQTDNLGKMVRIQCSKQSEIMAELDLLPLLFDKPDFKIEQQLIQQKST